MLVQPHELRGKKLSGEIIDKVSEGSTMSLVLQALSSTQATKQELDSVRRLLNEMEGKS